MPFTPDTASSAGKLGGGLRWVDKKPGTVRNQQLKISVTENERDYIFDKAFTAGLSMTELIVKAVKAYRV